MNVQKCVAALLCLYLSLSIHFLLPAQALRVGDPLPPALWSLPLKVVNHPAGKETLTLHEYKDQLIILDFWATWCSPCIAMMPRLDSLQKQFEGRIRIIPVTYQSRQEVTSFMDKLAKRTGRHLTLPEVVEDTVLHTLFPHTFIPHYVWIDPYGEVKAITGNEEISKEKITAFLSDKKPALSTKIDPQRIAYDNRKPFLVNGNGGDGNSLMYHAVFSGYVEGLKSGYYTAREPEPPYLTSKITVRNLSLPQIFSLAHAEGETYLGKNRIIYETADSLLLRGNSKTADAHYWNWMRQHTYCYEIIVPEGLESEIYKIMMQDLERMTRFTAKLEPRKQKYYALERTSAQDRLGSKGETPFCKVDGFGAKLKNQPLNQLSGRLNAVYLQHLPLPFFDQTGYTDPVDLEFSANMSSIESLNAALAPYHLAIREREGEIPMLVISNKNTNKGKKTNLTPNSTKQ